MSDIIVKEITARAALRTMCTTAFLTMVLLGCAAGGAAGGAAATMNEYSGDVVYVTGPQTNAIVWNASDFDAFDYGPNEGMSTETLTIAPYSLNGPYADRLIETGNLTYSTSLVWREYPIYKDLGLTVNQNWMGESGYWVGFLNGTKYVALKSANAEKLTIPLVEFDSNDIKTLEKGEEWDIGGGFTLVAQQIDIDGDKVYLVLYKNGVYLADTILNAGSSDLQYRVWTYTKDVAGESDVPVLSLYLSGLMQGTETDYVQIKYLFLIDDENILEISCDTIYDNMEINWGSWTRSRIFEPVQPVFEFQ